MPKGVHSSGDEGKYPKNGRGNKAASDEGSVSSPALNLKGRYDSIDESSSCSTSGSNLQSITNSLNKTALDVGSGSSNNVHSRVTCSNAEYKTEKWMLPDQAEDTLTQLNLAIVSRPLILVL